MKSVDDSLEATVRISAERGLLLRSIVNPDLHQAMESWHELVSRFNGESGVLAWCNSGIGERRLLPALAQRADELELSVEVREACDGARFEAWGLNERLFRDCTPVLTAIRESGCRMMCLKGNALLGDVYSPTEARAVGDFDLVVPAEEVRNVVAIMSQHEWIPQGNPAFYTTATRNGIRGIHAIDFFHSSGSSIDVHVRPAHDLRFTRLHLDEMWSEAVPVSEWHPLSALGIVRPNVIVQMLVITANVTRFDMRNPAHPLLDLCKIIQVSPKPVGFEVDWEELINRAEKYSALLRLKSVVRMLQYLGVPVGVHADSLRSPNRRSFRIEQDVIRIDRLIPDEKEAGARGSFRRAKSRVVRVTMGEGPISKVASFVVVSLETGLTKWRTVRAMMKVRRG